MVKTWSEFLSDKMPENDYDLAVISDAIWALGTPEDIRSAVSPEVFHLFVAMNAIGIWEGEGWGCLIGDNPVLVPYLPLSLGLTGFQSIADALKQVLCVFPDFTEFQDSSTYCDIINFLQNVRFKVRDERLSQYNPQQRAEMSRRFRQGIEALEDVTEPLWGDYKGWASILEQLKKYR